MARHPLLLLQHVRRLVGPPAAADDAELLERFLRQRDADAFALLLERHGPMVLRLCRRQLADVQAAEDAFQATFLVLARKAATIRPRERLAAWLYGVAWRVAGKARGQRPMCCELPEVADRQPDPLAQLSAREVLQLLDDEVARLPEVYRLPVVLCCLEGKTQEGCRSTLRR
jgi:RNA polymerase sigma factor (sigma-70 family)